ncbi:hypothetical protein J2S43_003650 [Catenuloplanes nepalensis]|uniref:Uncharacterized protein n=1 Tax=Catenuloplanes nepalensis TaxID=587533 RepID=A0ABT9MV79_9ACTN|nr:hypothetical protein [Catenuloplanes nepalensis]MDP9795138.1 hypothetical protein [Catenuloplanes nepalensis]
MITRRTRTLLVLPFAVLTALLLAGCPSREISPEEMERNPPVIETGLPVPSVT